MDLKKTKEVCNHFSSVADISLIVIDKEANVLLNKDGESGRCSFCRYINELTGAGNNCRMSHLYGSYQAQRFGGRYIFFCHLGLVHFASPIMEDGEMVGSIVGGPVLMIEPDEYLQDDILAKRRFSESEIYAMRERITEIPFISPEKVHSLSEMLFIFADYLGGQNTGGLHEDHESQRLQGVISDYIMRVKGKTDISTYPLEKENELLEAMSGGDVKTARALLNELLGHIFFYSGFQFDIIRSRILELIVLLSRAAVKGGADAELVFGLNYEYLKEIDKLSTIEDIAFWLSKIMSRFTDYVFTFVNAKHADVIYKSINYIKNNYMKKITLEEVAGYVYLSPAYFSKVFKDEVKSNFSAYLNMIRIEQSKKLLRNKGVNLSDISNMVGYEEQSYFSRVFKKTTGMSPLQYRQSLGK